MKGDYRLPTSARAYLQGAGNTPFFSVASLWEINIKSTLRRSDFDVDAKVLRQELSKAGFKELDIKAHHVLAVAKLPDYHKDPFDRLLIAQATVERMELLTMDRGMIIYGSPVRSASAV